MVMVVYYRPRQGNGGIKVRETHVLIYIYFVLLGCYDVNILELAGIMNHIDVFHKIYVSLSDKGLNTFFAEFFKVYTSLSSSDKICTTT